MKKLLTYFLALLTLILSLLSLSSCAQKKWVKVDLLTYFEGGIKAEYASGTTTLKFYIDPKSGQDVDDFSDMKITFQVVDGDERSNKRTMHPSVPEGARGNPELQYFYIVLEGEKINPEGKNEYIVATSAKGVLKSDETMVDDSSTPSVFKTILLGLLVTVIALVPTYLGLSLRDDPQGRVLLVIANLGPIIMNIYFYFAWGVLRGIILSVFCVITLALTFILSNVVDY